MKQISDEESFRALKKYNLLHTAINEDIDNDFALINESAALVCNVPFSNIGLFYGKEVNFIANFGFHCKVAKSYDFPIKKLVKESAFFEIPNIELEEAINNISCLKENKIKFFAGYPFFDPNGVFLGSINVYDSKPNALSPKQKSYLERVAKRITKIILDRRNAQVSTMMENLFESSDDLIFVSNSSGELLKVNPAFSKLLGYDLKDILKKRLVDFLLPEDASIFGSMVENFRENQHFVTSFTGRLITKNKEIKSIQWVGTPEEKTGLVYAIGRDTTDFIEQKKIIQKSESRFRSFFEHSQSLSCMHNTDGTFLSVNKTGADMAGYDSIDDLIGKSLYDIIPSERHPLLKEYLNIIKQKGQADGIMKVITKQGKIRTWMFNNVLQQDDQGNEFVIGSAVDLTERFELEEQLKKAKLDAEQASIAKSEFLANMSHEIRTPLNGIIGFTDLIIKSNLDETQRQYVNIINQSGTTLLSIINDVLDFSKIEAGKLHLTRVKVDLQDVAAQACSIISFAIEKKGLELLFDFSNDLPRYVWADETRLKQVLVNLLSNAVKFTEVGEVELKITPIKESGNGKTTIRFEVRDTGIGIREEKQTEIFEAFSQEDSSITKKYGGTGLGLTISNRLLKLADSKLQLDSKVGKGSRFYFDIDFKSEKEDLEDESLKDIKSVLVVDDNANNRRILQHMLELKAIKVDAVEGGLEALLLLKDGNEYDVIIMDYHMPIMDGIETIRKIKGNIDNKSQPIIMLYSSSDDESLQEACDELKVESRLVKPIKMREMYQVLAQLKKENIQQNTILKEEEEKKNSICKEGLKILIAEDNDVNMFLTKSIVKQIAHDAVIIEAHDGIEAVSKYQTEVPDIILMDVQMPNLNGIEATKQIRKIQKNFHVPILALTAGAMSGEKEKCMEAGMDDFMTKPVVKQTIADMFTKWIGTEITKEEKQFTEAPKNHIDRTWFDECTSDPDFKKEFIKLLSNELKNSVINLNDQVKSKDLEALKKTGHKLKGTSLTAGLTELSKLAIAFELLADLEEPYIYELLEKTTDEIEVVMSLLELE